MRFCPKIVTLILFSALGLQAQARYTVCTATINSRDEGDTFKSQLNPADFDFVELTNFNDKTQGSDNWFQHACESGVKCDVLVVSGHFGGNFFGASNYSLQLKDLETNSCQNRCPGILAHPKEVYLFGCNTLAGKEKDTRTPQQYLDVLVRDGVERADAERIVAARYGPFGSSYRDRMERVFEGVPMIYGFSSIGPLGSHVKTSLSEYLSALGNLKVHLDSVNVRSDNSTWMNVMKSYNRALGHGLTKNIPGYEIKTNSCSLSDDNKNLSERLSLATGMLEREPMLYLPTVSSFINSKMEHPEYSTRDENDLKQTRAQLTQLTSRGDLFDLFKRTADMEGVTASIKVDLLKSERNLGWITTSEFGSQMRQTFAAHTANPTTSGSDFICSQISEDQKMVDFLNMNDINAYPFNALAQFKVAGCAKIKDSAITERALRGFLANQARFRDTDLLYALSSLEKLPGHQAEKFPIFRAHLNYRGPMAVHVRPWLLCVLVQVALGSDQLMYLRESIKAMTDPSDFWQITDALAENPNKTEDSLKFLLSIMFSMKNYGGSWASTHIGLIPNSASLEDWIAARFNQIPEIQYYNLGKAMMQTGTIASDALKTKFIEYCAVLARKPGMIAGLPAAGLENFSSLLANSTLSKDQLLQVYEIYKTAVPDAKPYVRHILYQRGRGVIPLDKSIETEYKASYSCRRDYDSTSCSGDNYFANPH